MSEEPTKQKTIDKSIVNTKNVLHELDECLLGYGNLINRIDHCQEGDVEKSAATEKKQEFSSMTLTQKIHYIENNVSIVLTRFVELNKRFNELV